MRVLVVGTNRMCHTSLHEQGHEMVLLVPKGRAKRDDLMGPYRHVVVLHDDAPLDLWVEIARALHRQLPFGAVVAYNEHTYRIVTAISQSLDIPTMVDVALYDRVLDKSVARAILAQHQIPSCRYQVAHGRVAVLAAIEEVGLPCMVKPLAGEASLGVAKVGTPADVDAALHRVGAAQIERGVLVEEFLDGPEFSVEAISTGDEHHLMAITKKFIDEHTFVERGHLVPAPLEPGTCQSISDYVTRVLAVLGFHDCPSHTEIVLTGDGPRFVETHNRIGGDSIMDLVQLATGVDVHALVASQSLGEDMTGKLPAQVHYKCSAVVWYADPAGPSTNTLLEVRGVDRVAALPYVERVEVLKEPGSPLGAVEQSTDRSASVIVVGDTAPQALRRAHEAIGMLKFIYVWDRGDDGEDAGAP